MRKTTFLAILLGGMLSAQTTFTLVKDIYAGSLNSFPSHFTVLNNKLYFAAGSTVNGLSVGTELWESDGTEEGTKLTADIIPGTSGSAPANLFTFNNKIYFSGSNIVNGSNVSGLLHSYDVVNGVQLISASSKFAANFTGIDNKLYFKATNANVTPNTQRLFYLDGQGQANVADDNLNVNGIGFFGNKILANAQITSAPNIFVTQLFGFEGNVSGLIKTINPVNSGNPGNFYYSAALNKTFFSANGSNGSEPWITDGTEAGTRNLKDINISGANASSTPSNFMEYKGKVYFNASNGAENGAELWVTDGTEEGTKMLKDIVSGASGSSPEKMTVYNDRLYFLVTSTGNIRQLWESDGTESGTKSVATLASAANLVVYNNQLYISARISSTDTIGIELYRVNLVDPSLAVSEDSKSKIKVYPNPSKGEINITEIKTGSFELYDFSGKMVKKGGFEGGKISTVTKPGTYVLKVISADQNKKHSISIIIH